MIFRGFKRAVSRDREARAEEVCGVRPVEVREAAALPVVCLACGAVDEGFGVPLEDALVVELADDGEFVRALGFV